MKIEFFQRIIDVLREKIGRNNKILISNVLNLNFIMFFLLSKFEIIGNNNTIIFRGNFNLVNFFNVCRELEINIYGNNNVVDIEFPIKFKNSIIELTKNNNSFQIKSTECPVKDATIFVEDGSSASIGKNSKLKNKNLYIVVNNGYRNKPKLIIGDNVNIARDVIIRTSDGHSILDPVTKMAINEPQDIIIGDNVWITSRCTILKGAQIPNNCVVGACSLVNKKFTEENILIAGSPAKIIKRNILWDYRDYCAYMENYENEKK